MTDRSPPRPPVVDWSVVLPFYNEERFLEATLRSLFAQTRKARFILVDNASTDRSAELARRLVDEAGVDAVILEERRPGKASALKTGVAAVETPFVATCDADTFYPADYLDQAHRLFQAGDDVAAVLAFGVNKDEVEHGFWKVKARLVPALMPTQTHSGGYGQSFRTAMLKAVGGFGPDLWPYCLMDHEIMHRLTKIGRLRYGPDHWCATSDRRADRKRVRWTLAERLLYHVVPRSRRDWFFYEFLATRFDARRVSELNLREKTWTAN